MDTQTSELELFRDNVVRFLKEHVEPHYEKWEKEGITPRKLWNQMGDADGTAPAGGRVLQLKSSVSPERIVRVSCRLPNDFDATFTVY